MKNPLPSKLIQERVTISFEFMDVMEWGEVVSSAEFSIEVFSGVDPNSQDMRVGAAAPVGTVVTQKVQNGVAGVIYQVICTAIGSTGAVYKKELKLAVLPSQAYLPPLSTLFYTSWPYPIEAIDGIGDTGNLQVGTLYVLLYKDGIGDTGFVMSGTLEQILKTYSYTEGIVDTGAIIAGNLFAAIKTYSYTEGISDSAIPLAGTLEIILITYSNAKPEGILDAGFILSGTLE